MAEREYIKLLQRVLKKQRCICGYNQNMVGQGVVTTGIPKRYNEDKVTFTNQVKMSDENYITTSSNKPQVR